MLIPRCFSCLALIATFACSEDARIDADDNPEQGEIDSGDGMDVNGESFERNNEPTETDTQEDADTDTEDGNATDAAPCENQGLCVDRGPGFCPAGNGCRYVPPPGIPAPPFGIEETHRMYDDVARRNETLAYYPSHDGGFVTHVIDNTHPNCEDSSEFGTPDAPRCTVPRVVWELPAGSVAEIRGGPYSGGRMFWTMQGTSEQPVFIRGIGANGRVRLTGELQSDRTYLQGRYGITEGLEFYNGQSVSMSTNDGDGRSVGGEYLALRDCEIHNPAGFTGASGSNVSLGGEYRVVYDCHIHHNVREVNGEPRDSHGVFSAPGGRYHWVLDNEVNHNSGDGYQACHGCRERPPAFVYIGRNDFHDDFENAIDFKYIEDVVVSQNRLHSYRHQSDTGTVSPVVIGSDGASTRTWFLFNRIYDARFGIRVEESVQGAIIGNVFHDLSGPAINLEKQGTDLKIYNNTFNGVGSVIAQTWRVNFSLDMANNILANASDFILEFNSRDVVEASHFRHNLLWNNSGALEVELGDRQNRGTVSSTEELQLLLPGESNLVADPRLLDDHSVDVTSPAVDGGVLDDTMRATLQLYLDTFGVSLDIDRAGVARPQGASWDIGASER